MSEAIEIEYKSLLNQADYQRLLTRYFSDSTDSFTQTNVYYDTPDFKLKKRGMGLRIRTLAATAEQTLKSPISSEGLLETTDKLSLALAEHLITAETINSEGAVAKKLVEAGIEIDQLMIHGQLKTKRFEVQLEPTILLVLDESWYHGKHDFELEMEVSNALDGKEYFVKFLKENAIDYRVAKNKIVRTLEAKMSI